MKKIIIFILLAASLSKVNGQNLVKYNLSFSTLATKWDEAMPIGNGMLGALVWQKNNKVRLSLDRADLWDERNAMPDLSVYNFKWVEQQKLKKDYGIVQQKLDQPYDRQTYPTKLPAGAMEFDVSTFGKVVSNVLDIKTAVNTVKFDSGTKFKCFIHANQNQGIFTFENLKNTATLPELIVHNYAGNQQTTGDNSHAGEGLQKLGYVKGTVVKTSNTIRYTQPTYNGNYYQILIKWAKTGSEISGIWTVSINQAATLPDPSFDTVLGLLKSHENWWATFWNKSSVTVPDTVIQKQYYLEQYKLGSVARKGAPAITLQAVWTADNGSLPPWKGDFHNDLNTQLSYWPAYTSNHLAEGETFTDWLWKIKGENEKYTKSYFGVEGLNVPGVVTLNGYPMGGWIQYAMSPTVNAWCAQHFYWQWKYGMDRKFLDERAYPYITQSAKFLENISRVENGVRKLPLSSSPEYNDNSINAWFLNWTNFDLSLAKFLFKAAAEVSLAKGLKTEQQHWSALLRQLPELESNEAGLNIAPGQNLNESHRHMSQYMSIYPLALLDINKPADKVLIDNSFKRLEEKGTRAWCGYSFSWMASLYARAYEADKAVKQLQIFASNFCSINSFHLNGDQKGGQYSGFQYRPFTLEGNFAFAQGVNELLLQSRDGYVQVFPAVPHDWKDVSFSNLRTEGAFLISAIKAGGIPRNVKVLSEQGGALNIRLPFKNPVVKNQKGITIKTSTLNGITSISLKRGESVSFINKI
jgi:alpha-L-fucosidase 2